VRKRRGAREKYVGAIGSVSGQKRERVALVCIRMAPDASEDTDELADEDAQCGSRIPNAGGARERACMLHSDGRGESSRAGQALRARPTSVVRAALGRARRRRSCA
jgi:hypothetical protein